jgi:hypothetical protein
MNIVSRRPSTRVVDPYLLLSRPAASLLSRPNRSKSRSRLNFNLNNHALNPKFRNLNTSPNGLVVRPIALELQHDQIRRLIDRRVIGAYSIDIFPRQTGVHGFQGLFDVFERQIDLVGSVVGDASI